MVGACNAAAHLVGKSRIKTTGVDKIRSTIRTDVVLEHVSTGRRVVIDTKFTSIVTRGWYREERLRSGYVCQIYAYLRSQVGCSDSLADHASGLLLVTPSMRRSSSKGVAFGLPQPRRLRYDHSCCACVGQRFNSADHKSIIISASRRATSPGSTFPPP